MELVINVKYFMEFIEKKINGVWEIKLKPIEDSRGFFMRTFDENSFIDHNLNFKWVQENHSLSKKKGTLRGLHFQFQPYSEAKLIRTILGEIFDVYVDLRANSETFGQWDAIVLSEKMKNMLFIPKGFAHGYCTLKEFTEVTYKVDNYYSPEHEGGIIWNDFDIGIKWPFENPVLSFKDMNQPSFKEFCKYHKGIYL